MVPQAEKIVSLKREKNDWIFWALNFWVILAVIGAMGILTNMYPLSMLEETTTLAIFNAKYGIVFPVLAMVTAFFAYGAYRVDKRMRQGFTHCSTKFYAEEN